MLKALPQPKVTHIAKMTAVIHFNLAKTHTVRMAIFFLLFAFQCNFERSWRDEAFFFVTFVGFALMYKLMMTVFMIFKNIFAFIQFTDITLK